MSNANERQVDGAHYRRAALQHWDFTVLVLENRYLEGCITKYVSRWRWKAGLIDLQKAEHFLQKLIEEAEAGRVRPLGTQPELFDFAAYGAAYGLTREEIYILRRLSTWADVSDLGAVLGTLRYLIDGERQRQQLTAPRAPRYGDDPHDVPVDRT